MSNDSYIKDALNEIKSKFGEIEDLQEGVKGLKAKIEDISVAEVNDVRDAAKTAKEAKEAVEKLEASLEKLPAQWRDEVKNIIDTQPDPKRQSKTKGDEWVDVTKMSDDDFAKSGSRPREMLGQPEGTVFRTSFASPYERQKAVTSPATDLDSVPGYQVRDVNIWNKAIVGDPWPMAGAFQMPLQTGNWKTLEASTIAFDAAQAKPSATAFDAPTGGVEATDQTTTTHTMRVLVSHNQEDDVQGITAYILRMIQLAYGKTRGGITTKAVVGGVLAGNSVASGFAATSISNANALSKLLSMTAQGNVADYWPMGASYVLHPGDYVTLLQSLASSGGINLDPTVGLPALASWPVLVDTQAESNATAAKFPNFFGAWEMALVQAQVGRLTVDRYMATIPGAMAIYAQFRFKPVVVNSAAYSQIQVKA